MDVAYNQHAARRKNRSSTNLNHLTLAPLTSRLPLQDSENDNSFADHVALTPSYLQGKSAPTTPRLLSRSPGRSSHSRTRGTSVPSAARLPKSKSATHLAPSRTGAGSRQSAAAKKRAHDSLTARDRSDSDWLLRAGALISTETRESKGQAWLVSRASSTSLAGMRDPDDEAFARELAHERELLAASRSRSRRHSLGAEDAGDRVSSPPYSRRGSRAASRVGSRSQLATPLELRSVDGYFPSGTWAGAAGLDDESSIPGPDFVNLDETLEASEGLVDTIVQDEAYVRRLVKKGNGGAGSWLGSVLGVQLFSVEEDLEESDGGETETTEGELDEGEEPEGQRASSARRIEGFTTALDQIPPPKADEGGWHDAAWLLTVASKVLL